MMAHGGLLILFSNQFNNEGTIEANGVDNTNQHDIQGGSSGGGSINIFYEKLIANQSCIAKGGETIYAGGAGGSGSISMGSIASGNYVEENI